jgi:hypothetical protein
MLSGRRKRKQLFLREVEGLILRRKTLNEFMQVAEPKKKFSLKEER